ncbi:MAG: dephospho-CoA kinase [Acidobacteria bacterium]|nr:dephospho-CoA kinase [Acidobacteriota bacterium]
MKVGLTGGIATGKSYVLADFARLGARVIDADEVAHRVIRKGQPAYRELLREFGGQILGLDGEIERKTLGTLVFSDEAKLRKLNFIVHPKVFEEEERELHRVQSSGKERRAIIVVDAALMIETGSYKRYDKVVVVFCTPELQLARLIARDHLSPEEAALRISRQMPIMEKIKYADYAIDTSGKFVDTRRQVKRVYTRLVADQQRM